MPLGARGVNYTIFVCFHSLMNLYTCAKFGPNRSRGLEAFPDLWINDPPRPQCPSGINGLMFSSCLFPDEYAYMCQMCFRSVQLYGFFPTFLNLWPPWPPPNAPWGSRDHLLAYVHSLIKLYTCAKFYPDRSSGLEAFPDLWIDDPLKPSGIKGLIFRSCPFPD